MAPTKKDVRDSEKEAKLTPEQSAALIRDYLHQQNRPYSATDISTNLKNRVSKAAAAKLLKDMHERKEIEGRSAGKQIVYHAVQDEAEEAGVEQLQEMAAKTTRLRDATTALKTQERELRLTLREGTSSVPLWELKAAVVALEQEKATMNARLATLKSGDLKPVSLEEREEININYRKWQRAASARKKIRDGLWNDIKAVLERDEVDDTKEKLGLEL